MFASTLTPHGSALALPAARPILAVMAALFGCAAAQPALAADDPGIGAIEQFREESTSKRAVENRFFLKGGRFEIAPWVGYVPNNPFARRYTGGAILGYHFGETISAQANVGYSPDFGEDDLKSLTGVLLDRAYQANTFDTFTFQQPLDKVELGASFGLAWAPLYGKINLVGETVLNFDFYGFAGAGMVSKNNYAAVYDEAGAALNPPDVVQLNELDDEVKVTPVLGIGANFFLNQIMAFKIDARSAFYIDNKPQYKADEAAEGQRLYNNFTASGGLAFFFPKMKPRLYDF